MSLADLKAAAAAAPPIANTVPEDLNQKLIEVSKYLREINTERSAMVKKRDALITEAVKAGAGYAYIAGATGLSAPQIFRVMNRDSK